MLESERSCKQDNHATVSCTRKQKDGGKSNSDKNAFSFSVHGSIYFFFYKNKTEFRKPDSVVRFQKENHFEVGSKEG